MIDIKKLHIEELKDWLINNSFSAVHAPKILRQIWKNNCSSFDDLFQISPKLVTVLKQQFVIGNNSIESQVKSSDGTIKIMVRLCDNALIESVLIPSGSRLTACISSQVGCAVGCSFCATAQMGFVRNLSYVEICNQVVLLNTLAQAEYGKSIDSVVFMGMGEPLLNFENLQKSLNIMAASWALGFSHNKITISTSGIISGINALTNSNIVCNLAISLHSARNSVRSSIMPINNSNTIIELKKAIQLYCTCKNKKVTFEYLLLHQVNDSIADAMELVEFLKDIPSKVNVINYNQTKVLPYTQSLESQKKEFIKYVHSAGVIVIERKSKGSDIAAACGQLLLLHKKTN